MWQVWIVPQIVWDHYISLLKKKKDNSALSFFLLLLHKKLIWVMNEQFLPLYLQLFNDSENVRIIPNV